MRTYIVYTTTHPQDRTEYRTLGEAYEQASSLCEYGHSPMVDVHVNGREVQVLPWPEFYDMYVQELG